MKQTRPTTPRQAATKSQSAESSTFTSGGDEDALKAAARQGAIAGNPTSEELEDVKVSKAGIVDGHAMKKTVHMDRPFWKCARCTYSTFNETSAREHEQSPR